MPKLLRGPLVVLLGAALGAVPGTDVTAPSSGVDTSRIPATAREFLPLVTDLTAQVGAAAAGGAMKAAAE